MHREQHDLCAERNQESSRQDGATVLAALLRGVAPAFGFTTVIVFFLSPTLFLNVQNVSPWLLIVSLYQLGMLLSTIVRLMASIAVLAPGPKGGLQIENRWSVFPNNVDHAAFSALLAMVLSWMR
jgi:hypothetical protein